MPLIADRMALVSYGSSDEGSDLGSDREEEEEKSTPQQPVTKKSFSPEQPPPQNSNNVSSPPKVPYKLLRNCIIQLFEFQLFKMYVRGEYSVIQAYKYREKVFIKRLIRKDL